MTNNINHNIFELIMQKYYHIKVKDILNNVYWFSLEVINASYTLEYYIYGQTENEAILKFYDKIYEYRQCESLLSMIWNINSIIDCCINLKEYQNDEKIEELEELNYHHRRELIDKYIQNDNDKISLIRWHFKKNRLSRQSKKTGIWFQVSKINMMRLTEDSNFVY